MDNARALQLIDAHLDDQELTEAEALELSDWLRETPGNADQAFHRIFLHSYLRERLLAGAIPASSHTLPAIDVVSGSSISQSPQGLAVPRRTPVYWKLLTGGTIGLLLVVVGVWIFFGRLAIQPLEPPAVAIAAKVYEGFDYPPSNAIPMGRSSEWPTTGGLDGLDGGWGWATPWRESGTKVAIIEDDPAAHAWEPEDMRKFGPLGYSDSAGNVLVSTGLQMRTSAGPLSISTRDLDLRLWNPESAADRPIGVDGTIVWFSLLAQSFDSSGAGRFVYLQFGTDDAGLRIGKLASAPSGNWAAAGLLNGAEVNLKASLVPSGEVTFLVGRILFRPGAEQLDLWLNPGLDTEPAAAGATLQLPVPDFRLERLVILSRYSTDFDEFRFGRTFREVAPLQSQR